MRPRPNDRGNPGGIREALGRGRGFNEAAAERPRKCEMIERPIPFSGRFNEAAAERPRK